MSNKVFYEILNNNAFVVTKVDNELKIGFYHDVYNCGDTERLFEPICPLAMVDAETLLNYAENAE